jgi:hypothetical protein
MSNTTPQHLNDAQTTLAVVKRVQALSPDDRDLFLFGLIGRMIVIAPDTLEKDLAEAEALNAEYNTEAANDRS